MTPFTTVTASVASLRPANTDTDIIFPARFLVITDKIGLGRYTFHDRPDLALLSGTSILIAGENFGCGSSREQAVWALADVGIRVIVAPSFGEIFRSNCFKTGVLPIELEADQVERLHLIAQSGAAVTADLTMQQIVMPDGSFIAFTIEPARRAALLAGLDEIADIHNRFAAAIATFETAQRRTGPWLWPPQESPAHV